MLKNAVVILVLITVAKRFLAADQVTAAEAPTTSPLQEASQEPEETTRRDGQFGGRYPVELCNPFYEYWANHTVLWTLRSSDSAVSKCKREERKYLNATGVLLTKLSRLNNQTTSRDYYWTFGEDGAIYYYYKGCSNYEFFNICYDFRKKEVLEYQSSTNNCSVVRIEEWGHHTGSQKEKYLAACQRSNDSWCDCNSTVDAQENKLSYYCLNNLIYELVKYDAPSNIEPEDCKEYYDRKRVLYRRDDLVVYEKGCEK